MSKLITTYGLNSRQTYIFIKINAYEIIFEMLKISPYFGRKLPLLSLCCLQINDFNGIDNLCWK